MTDSSMGLRVVQDQVFYGDWFICSEGNTLSVRREYRTSRSKRTKSQRLPREKYKHLVDDRKELERFVLRLNGTDPDEKRAKQNIEFRRAFIAERELEEYSKLLRSYRNNVKDRKTILRYLTNYAIGWFVVKKGLPDPRTWHQYYSEWGLYLINTEPTLRDELRIFPSDELEARKLKVKGKVIEIMDYDEETGEHFPKKVRIMSEKTIKYIVQEFNRFLDYLSEANPTEYASIKPCALLKKRVHRDGSSVQVGALVRMLKTHEMTRKSKLGILESEEQGYIWPEHWEAFQEKLERTKNPYTFHYYLAFRFGLRRSEILTLRPGDLRNEGLLIERQFNLDASTLEQHGHERPTKGRTRRIVPFWLVEQDELEQVQVWLTIVSQRVIHPDVLTADFRQVMDELVDEGKIPENHYYKLHNLRHTFCTNALELPNVKIHDVQKAAGHEDISTTQKHYLKNKRRSSGLDVWSGEGIVKERANELLKQYSRKKDRIRK